MTIALIILVLSALFNFLLSNLYRRRYQSEIDRRNGRIDRLESTVSRQRDYICSLEGEIRRLDGYNRELQRRCGRRQVKRFLPGPNFSDYFLSDGGIVRHSRVWWN